MSLVLLFHLPLAFQLCAVKLLPLQHADLFYSGQVSREIFTDQSNDGLSVFILPFFFTAQFPIPFSLKYNLPANLRDLPTFLICLGTLCPLTVSPAPH